ncbi:sugar efflux transporter [Gottfriedia acidiceleris]|uniref:sugar efflux transporter n=1 Tax=Gottfriedia acidiceleris TaxID=371036 RepID=UPI003D2385C5
MNTKIKSLFNIKGYPLLGICLLLVGTGVSISLPYVSLYLTENMGISAGAFGIFMALSQLSGVFVNSFFAKRSDKGMSRKWIVLIALFSQTLGYASYLVFGNFIFLLIAFTFFSGFGAPAIPQIFAYAQESTNESNFENKKLALFLLRSLVSLGVLSGPLLGTVLIEQFGYTGLFKVTSIIFLINILLVLLFLKERKKIRTNEPNIEQNNNSLVKNKKLRLMFISFVVLFTVNAVNFINTPLFIIKELGGVHSDVGLVFGISATLEIPIMLLLGVLGKKFSNHTILIIGSLIAISYFAIVSVSTHSWHLMAAQILMASFTAILLGNGLSYFNELLPESPGVAASMHANSDIFGRILGSVGAGVIADFAGFRVVNIVCFTIIFFSLFILWKTKPQNEISVSTENGHSINL